MFEGKMTTENGTIYNNGYVAYIKGVMRDDCPYSTKEHGKLWFNGWDDAYKDDMAQGGVVCR